MRVTLLGINYNSPVAVRQLVGSITNLPEGLALDVVILDNSPSHPLDPSAAEFRTAGFRTIVARTPSNLGYFGAAQWWLDQNPTLAQEADWIIVSNVDLEFDRQFFGELAVVNDNMRAGVIAPAIISIHSGRDQNPFMSRRPSLQMMRAYRLLYSLPRVYVMYEKLSVAKRYLQKVVPRGPARRHCSSLAYAPHGACVLFHRTYFRAGGDLRHPAFLYGEEIFVAETARLVGVQVHHLPTLKVRHCHQTSTSLLSARQRATHSLKAFTAIIKKYFL